MSFGVVSVSAETDCFSLMVPLSVTVVNGKTTFGRSLVEHTADCFGSAWPKSPLTTEVRHPFHAISHERLHSSSLKYVPRVSRHILSA